MKLRMKINKAKLGHLFCKHDSLKLSLNPPQTHHASLLERCTLSIQPHSLSNQFVL